MELGLWPQAVLWLLVKVKDGECHGASVISLSNESVRSMDLGQSGDD